MNSRSDMADVPAQIDDLAQKAAAELDEVDNADQLEQFRIRFLGANGSVRKLSDLIKQVPADQKRAIGQQVNTVKQQVTAAFDAKKSALGNDDIAAAGPPIDITEPGRRPVIGRRHILTQVMDELTELFARMGFAQASGPEVEDEFHNFIALNIPKQHPARDPLDNFYLVPPIAGQSPSHGDRQEGQMRLLRTQTSTVQIRIMQGQQPPIRVVIPGRVYRPDTHDATHLSMFHQLEALVVDRGVTMVDLKSTILQFVQAYFGRDTQVRFRPSFFPFTEPSAEVDVWFPARNKWIELGGCGMVHPNVFEACGIDPEIYNGWAFGFGIDRIAMRKYGIEDIRLLVENDVRFLRQF